MSKTTTVTKPAAKAVTKPAAAKAAPAAKVETKVAPKTAAKVEQKAPAAAKAETASKPKLFYVLADIARPVSGSLLFAHTLAAMHVLGMLGDKRPAVRTAALQAFVGSRAIRYHSVTKDNFAVEGDKVRLSPAGQSFFAARNADGKVAKADFEAFVQIFTKGTVPKDFAVKASNIVPAPLSL